MSILNTSSIESQIQNRTQKVEALRQLGIDPFAVTSKRDCKLDFVKFWFDFVHKFDYSKVLTENNEYPLLAYFVREVLFPMDLLQATEERARARFLMSQMELEEDDIDNSFDSELIEEARILLPNLSNFSSDLLEQHHYGFFGITKTQDYDELVEQMSPAFEPNAKLNLVGRIKSKRVSGKIAFLTIEDESCPEGFQFIIKADDLIGNVTFAVFKEFFEEGDYVQGFGMLDYSKSGEPSLFVTELTLLTKSLRPLPEILDYENTESRYLDRTADYKMNTKDEAGLSVRDVVRLKAKYWAIWRDEMEKEGFLSVEIPTLESIPGGAEAKPFTTFYNELDQEMYLRLSLELPLKKLVAGGFEAVYEIGRVFRNEGSSPMHLQEYTAIEWYKAYTDYHWAASFTKRVYQRIVKEILGTYHQVDYYGNNINWGEWCTQLEADKNNWTLIGGWPKIEYFDAVRYFSNGEIDVENKTAQELVEMCQKYGMNEVRVEDGMATLYDKLWKKARVNTVNPFFLILPPVELEPLAKRDPNRPTLTQRWQVVAGRAEHGKAFSELNDPIDQFGRFEEQQTARDNGNDEAQFMDPEYIKAMEYGMPPMSGFGVSERFLSSLLGKHIKECVTFPYTREEKQNNEIKNIQVVLLDNSQIPLWSKLNTASHLTASLSARNKYQVLGQDKVTTLDGKSISLSIPHPIVIRETSNQESLKNLILEAKKMGLQISEFTTDNRDGKSQAEDILRMSNKNYSEIEYLGIAIFGDKKKTEKLTSKFSLFGENSNLASETKKIYKKI